MKMYQVYACLTKNPAVYFIRTVKGVTQEEAVKVFEKQYRNAKVTKVREII